MPGDTPGLLTIVAGVGDSIGTRVDSLATRTKLTDPASIAFDDASGTLFVADRGSTVTENGKTRPVARLFSIRSDGTLTMLVDGRTCPADCLESVHSMAVVNGDIVLTDPVGQRIYRVRPGQLPTVIAGTGAAGDAADGTPAVSADLRRPTGIVSDNAGRILFSEQSGNRVRAIGTDGTLSTVAGTGSAGESGDGGPATAARLNGPSGLAVSDGGILYIADRLNARVRAVSLQTGTITRVAGTFPGFGGDGGPAVEAALDRPESVAIADDGLTLYIADTGNDRVRAVNLRTGTIETFGGTGSTAFNGAGHVAGNTALDSPAAVETSATGFLFIVDSGHSIVWRTRILPTPSVR